MTTRQGMNPALLGLALTVGACSSPNASTLTHPPRKASFPMYISIPGITVGQGSIVKIDAPADLDGTSEAQAVATGLTFPAGVAVDRGGALYYVERPSADNGRVMRILAEGETPEEVISGLVNPQGLALDKAGRLYVAETGMNRVCRVEFEKPCEEVKTGLASPRSISADENDNLYVTEFGSGTVTKLIPDGETKTLASSLVNPIGAGPGLVDNIVYLVGNTGLADGQAVRIDRDGNGSEVYASKLINPRAIGWEDATIMYIAEGNPALRVTKFSSVTKVRTEAASLPGEPHSMAFTPID